MHRVEANSVHPGYRYIGDKSPHKCGYRKRVAALPLRRCLRYCRFFCGNSSRVIDGRTRMNSLAALARSSLVPLVGPCPSTPFPLLIICGEPRAV